MSDDDVLASIDRAIADYDGARREYDVSDDAMRWTPEVPAPVEDFVSVEARVQGTSPSQALYDQTQAWAQSVHLHLSTGVRTPWRADFRGGTFDGQSMTCTGPPPLTFVRPVNIANLQPLWDDESADPTAPQLVVERYALTLHGPGFATYVIESGRL